MNKHIFEFLVSDNATALTFVEVTIENVIKRLDACLIAVLYAEKQGYAVIKMTGYTGNEKQT